MDARELQYRKDLEWLTTMLKNVGDQIQAIADRFGDGAMLTYPEPYKNAELSQKHAELTAKSDEIVNKMQALHKRFNDPTPATDPVPSASNGKDDTST